MPSEAEPYTLVQMTRRPALGCNSLGATTSAQERRSDETTGMSALPLFATECGPTVVGTLGQGTTTEVGSSFDHLVIAGEQLVPRHSDYDWLILSRSRMGKSFGATRIWMLLATPG
jgi:hypothetical protein